MPTSSKHKELFRASTTKDKLTLFQILLDANLLTADVSLALLKVIHEELSANQEYDRSLYKSYAVSISALDYYTSDMLQQVADAWKEMGNGNHK